MRILKVIMIVLGFFLFEFATCWIRAFNIPIDLPIGFTKYLLVVWFLIAKGKLSIKQAFLWFTTAIIIIYLTGIIIDQKLPLLGFPNIFTEILGVWAGCILANKNTGKTLKLFIPVVVLIFSIWYIAFKGYDHYLSLMDGDGFNGRMEATAVNNHWKVYNSNKDTFTDEDCSGKIVYLDFWTTNCGVCFVKFPELEQLYRQHKNNRQVVIQAVNIPIERDTSGMAFYMIERSNIYSFPVVVGSDLMRAIFKVTAYPTVVILKDNKIVFRGRTELAKSALESIMKQP